MCKILAKKVKTFFKKGVDRSQDYCYYRQADAVSNAGNGANIENNIVQRFCKRTESLFPGSEPKAERPEEKITERETSTILK